MNIFVLDENPEANVQMYGNRHVVKMPLESVMMLCTAHRILDGNDKKILPDERNDILYKATHINHPCTVWARESDLNYMYHYRLAELMFAEYSFRYKKIHKSSLLMPILKNLPNNITKTTNMSPFAQAMPDEYKNKNAVIAYRTYYINDKQHLAEYKERNRPEWFLEK